MRPATLLVLLVAVSVGCSSAPSPGTGPAVPEVVIRQTTPERVSQELAARIARNGWTIRESTPQLVVGEKELGILDAAVAQAAGGLYNGRHRVTFTILAESTAVRVIGRSELAGTGRATDSTKKNRTAIQTALDGVRETLEPAP